MDGQQGSQQPELPPLQKIGDGFLGSQPQQAVKTPGGGSMTNPYLKATMTSTPREADEDGYYQNYFGARPQIVDPNAPRGSLVDAENNTMLKKLGGIHSGLMDSKQEFVDKALPSSIDQIQDYPYKLKGGMAVNLGLPMDAFMTADDFRRTGTAKYLGRNR